MNPSKLSIFQTNGVSAAQPQTQACLPSAPALGSDVRRDVDGVDADLRDKISERLPSIDDQEQAAEAAAAASAAAAAAAARDSREDCPGADTTGAGSAAAARVTLTPATLARALPHIRRLTGNDGKTGSVRGALGLLRGGGLVFPAARAATAAAMKQTEVSLVLLPWQPSSWRDVAPFIEKANMQFGEGRGQV